MPRSKRNTVIALTKTDKKTKEHKGELITTIRTHAEEFQFLWIFDVEHMRNNILQEVRTAWKGSRCVRLSCTRTRADEVGTAGSSWEGTR